MMWLMATTYLFGGFLQSLANKEIDLDTDALKLMLCTSAYTPNQDTHRYKSSVTNEVVGTNYTAGGVTLTSVVAAYTAGTNTFNLDAADTVFTNVTLTARYGVLYDSSPGSDATRPLIQLIDFVTDQSPAGVDFTMQWNAGGLFSQTV